MSQQYVYSMLRVSKVVPPQKTIIKDISLSFFPGAKIGLLGLNGTGKSTVLRIMAGVDKEFEGEAVPMGGIKIGYLPQEPELDPENRARGSGKRFGRSGCRTETFGRSVCRVRQSRCGF